MTTSNDIARKARELREYMSPKDRDVSGDMLGKLQRWGSLSDRQWSYLGDMVRRAEAASLGEVAPTRAPAVVAPAASFPRILAMFGAAAAAGIKAPRIRFLVGDRKLALATSKYPNSARVIDAKADEGTRAWHGWIDGKGWHKAKQADSALAHEILKALQAIEADPVGQAKLYGQLTRECNMCGRELTTRESLTAGYGPICAGKFGLAWGHVDKVKLASMRRAPLEVAANITTATTEERAELDSVLPPIDKLERPAPRPAKPSMADALRHSTDDRGTDGSDPRDQGAKPYDDIPF